jgi:ADP-ribose pyrophosphatase YjhB (NUDIX family)
VVREQTLGSGPVWWCPPGGGLEAAESVFEAARREVGEETGLAVCPERVAYIREFVEPTRQAHHLELFLRQAFPPVRQARSPITLSLIRSWRETTSS